MKENTQAKPNISKIAFWDVNFDNIDFEENSLFVMDKVFNYGIWTDIIEVFRFYGLERVKKEIVQAPYFKKTTLSFLCVILNLEEKDFVSYQRRQARKPIWNY
jgi:hypothetical protein